MTNRLALALVLSTTLAHAQAPNPADAAFKRGRELVAAGKHADACVEFEHSQKLDPAKGTMFNIALCSEKTGKLARALELCRELAATDTKLDRKKVVLEMIPKLEARVPHLVIKAPTPPLGFLLTITPINSGLPPRAIEANKPLEIDFGEFTVTAKASGVTPWTQNLRVDTESKTITIEVPFANPGGPTETPPTPTNTPTATDAPAPTVRPLVGERPDPEAPSSHRRLYGVIGIGVGGAAIAAGMVFGFQAKNTWNDAKDVCDGQLVCTTSPKFRDATDLRTEAKNKALMSTIFVGAGVAVATVGVVLFVTAPTAEGRTRVTAHPTHDGGAITLSGSF